MKPPDTEAHQQAVQAINDEIDKLRSEKQSVQDVMAKRSDGRDDYYKQRSEMREQLNEIHKNLEQFESRKEGISTDIGKKEQEKKDQRLQINKLKRNIGYENEGEIDDRIATIEFKLWTESISLKEEKKFLQEIAELKRNRPKVSQVQTMEEGLKSQSTSGTSKEELNQIGADMFQLRERRREVMKQIKELDEGRKDQMGDWDEQKTKREDLNKQVQDKVAERNRLRDDFTKEKDAYYEWTKAERQKKQEKDRELRDRQTAERRQKQKQAEADKLDEQPYLNEITLIEQTIAFCKSLVQDKGPAVKEDTEKKDLNVFEGAEVLVKKEDREEFYFAPTGKGKKKAGKKTKGDGASKPIKHNAETFRLFDRLKLEAPITTDDVPSRLEQLQEQLEDFQKKVKDWELTRDEKKRKILNDEVDEEETPQEKEVVQKEEDKADGDNGQGEEEVAGAADAAEEGKAED